MRPELLKRRAETFANRKGLTLDVPLGAGVQGIVWATMFKAAPGHSAVKVHEAEPNYRRERDVYLRLREYAVTSLRGCNVPALLDHDDELLVLEMEIVRRPFVLDFGGAYLDDPPDFPDDVLAEWEREKREQYGDRWPEVRAILRELERLGVYMIDVHPGNVSFGDDH